MNIPGLLYLLIAHFLCGRGMLQLFRVKLQPLAAFCLSMILGVAMLSFVPCFVQLMNIPITLLSISIGIAILTAVLSIPLLLNARHVQFKKITFPFGYEWPFILIIFLLVLVSVWRCFYYPPISRDMLTGPELLAEYAVRERTMVSSVFSVDLSTTNNFFKSPYITGLQIIYKLLVSSFGQTWLSVLFISFTVWLYSLARSFIHPLAAGFLLLFFVTIPDLYAYTFLILYDYSTTIFFFCGFYFLHRYKKNQLTPDFALSVFLFGIATYIRTETVVLVTMVAPFLFAFLYKMRLPAAKIALRLAIFIAVPFSFYVLCIDVFVRNFIPIPFDLGSQVNPHLSDISFFFKRLWDMCSVLIFSASGIREYGYFIFFFCGVLLADVFWIRRFNSRAVIALYGVAVVYFGMAFLGYLLPLVDLPNTTKRGMFKALPLMLFYMCNSGLMLRLSAMIKNWEIKEKAAGPAA